MKHRWNIDPTLMVYSKLEKVLIVFFGFLMIANVAYYGIWSTFTKHFIIKVEKVEVPRNYCPDPVEHPEAIEFPAYTPRDLTKCERNWHVPECVCPNQIVEIIGEEGVTIERLPFFTEIVEISTNQHPQERP